MRKRNFVIIILHCILSIVLLSLCMTGCNTEKNTTGEKEDDATAEEITDRLHPSNQSQMADETEDTRVLRGRYYDACSGIYGCTGWCSRQIAGYNGTLVTVESDHCDPFSVVAGDFGEIKRIYDTPDRSAPESTIASFNAQSEAFSAFMKNFDIPTDGTKYVPEISDDALSSYTEFFTMAIEVYKNNIVTDVFTGEPSITFTENASNDLSLSAVIGANHPYAMTFGTDVSPEEIDLQAVIANLFGFSSKADFMSCAQDFADIYTKYRNDVANSLPIDPVDEALDDGCFFTENGTFIFPFAVKNALPSTVLAYVILDTDGAVSVWVNDITAALWATNFNRDYYTGHRINNILVCKNLLFVSGRSLSCSDYSGDPLFYDPKLYISPFFRDNYSYTTQRYITEDLFSSDERDVTNAGRNTDLTTKSRRLGQYAGLIPMSDDPDDTYEPCEKEDASVGFLWDYYAEDNLFHPYDVSIYFSFGHGIAEEIVSSLDHFPTELKLYFANDAGEKIYVREYNDFNTGKYDYSYILDKNGYDILHVDYNYTEKITIPSELFTAKDGKIYWGFESNSPDPHYNQAGIPFCYHKEDLYTVQLYEEYVTIDNRNAKRLQDGPPYEY